MKGDDEMRILLTGFEPYGGDTVNASQEVVKALPEVIGGHTIHRLIFPVTFAHSIDRVNVAITHYRSDLVICLGQSVGRREITLERVAINLQDAPIPDNAGAQPVDTPVMAGGPAAFFSTLPVKAMVRTLTEAGYPAALSQSAGTFVSNHLFYGLMYHLDHLARRVRGGLVTLPQLPEQTSDEASMSREQMIKAVELLILTAADTETDLAEPGGKIC